MPRGGRSVREGVRGEAGHGSGPPRGGVDDRPPAPFPWGAGGLRPWLGEGPNDIPDGLARGGGRSVFRRFIRALLVAGDRTPNDDLGHGDLPAGPLVDRPRPNVLR